MNKNANTNLERHSAEQFYKVIEDFFDKSSVGNYVEAHNYLLDQFLDTEELPDDKFTKDLVSTTLAQVSFLASFKESWDRYKSQIEL